MREFGDLNFSRNQNNISEEHFEDTLNFYSTSASMQNAGMTAAAAAHTRPLRLGNMDMVELIPRQATLLRNQAQEYPQSRPASPVAVGPSLPPPLILRPERLFSSRSTNQIQPMMISQPRSTNQNGPSISSNPFLFDCQSPTLGDQQHMNVLQHRPTTTSTLTSGSSLLSDHLEEEKDREAGYRWLNFTIVDADGGQTDDHHGVDRVLEDDETVYCSQIPRNVNLLLRSIIPEIPDAHPTFTLSKVVIKIPTADRYTAPLRDGFLFVLSEALHPSLFSQFDDYDGSGLVERTRRNSNGGSSSNLDTFSQAPPPPAALPQVPSSVLAVLYFQLDQKTPVFAYQFRWPIRKASYVMVKMLGSYGTRENIDVQFVGFKGTLNQVKFPSVGLR